MKKYLPYILIGLMVILIIVVVYYLSKPVQTQPINPGPPANPTAGLISQVLGGIFSSGWLKNIFGGNNNSGTIGCDSGNPGYNNAGQYTTACGGVAGGGDNCNPARPGYDMNGFLSTNCGA